MGAVLGRARCDPVGRDGGPLWGRTRRDCTAGADVSVSFSLASLLVLCGGVCLSRGRGSTCHGGLKRWDRGPGPSEPLDGPI